MSVFLSKLPSEHWVTPMLCDARSIPLCPAAHPCRDRDVWCLRQGRGLLRLCVLGFHSLELLFGLCKTHSASGFKTHAPVQLV